MMMTCAASVSSTDVRQVEADVTCAGCQSQTCEDKLDTRERYQGGSMNLNAEMVKNVSPRTMAAVHLSVFHHDVKRSEQETTTQHEGDVNYKLCA